MDENVYPIWFGYVMLSFRETSRNHVLTKLWYHIIILVMNTNTEYFISKAFM